MALLHYLWSRVAASNATSDASVNWSEGQSPSSVNDSARAMMASAAAFRDDIAGAIVTGGTSTAYTVTSYQIFDTLAHMSGQMIAFTPHATNGATVTLNVDGLGAKPLRSAPSVELPAGVLILGSPYVALYNNSDAVWYLQNFYVSPYSIPLGGMIDYTGSTAPNSAFVLPIGQAISRTTYASYFSLVSTTYGVGDGSTTFNVPDLTGRVTAMKEATATRLTTAGGGIDGGTLGAVGGVQNVTLVAGQIPSITSTASPSLSVSVTSANWVASSTSDSTGINPGSTGGAGLTVSLTGGLISKIASSGTATGTVSSTSNNTGSTAVKTVMPAIIVNKILRVI